MSAAPEPGGVAIHGPLTVVANDPQAFIRGMQKAAKRGRFRSVELARRQEVDTWELADAIYEDVLAELPDGGTPPSGEHGVHSGLNKAEEIVEAAHRDAGTEITKSYLRALFTTVRSWPPEDRRPDLASFDAHFELRGKDYKNRAATLERLASKSRNGRVSRKQVVIWKSERKPVQTRSFLDLIDRRLRASLKAAGTPWNTVADSDRESIAKILRSIATEVEDGTFPGR